MTAKARLEWSETPEQRESFPLAEAGILIGRRAGVDILLNHPFVSTRRQEAFATESLGAVEFEIQVAEVPRGSVRFAIDAHLNRKLKQDDIESSNCRHVAICVVFNYGHIAASKLNDRHMTEIRSSSVALRLQNHLQRFRLGSQNRRYLIERVGRAAGI